MISTFQTKDRGSIETLTLSPSQTPAKKTCLCHLFLSFTGAEGTGQLSPCVSNESAWRSDRVSQCVLMRTEEKQETGCRRMLASLLAFRWKQVKI